MSVVLLLCMQFPPAVRLFDATEFRQKQQMRRSSIDTARAVRAGERENRYQVIASVVATDRHQPLGKNCAYTQAIEARSDCCQHAEIKTTVYRSR